MSHYLKYPIIRITEYDSCTLYTLYHEADGHPYASIFVRPRGQHLAPMMGGNISS